jgi:hypothetical protein
VLPPELNEKFMNIDTLLLMLSCIGIVLCLLSFMRLRRHFLSGSVALALSLAFTGSAAILSKDILSYRHLSDEQLVARVFISGRESQQFIVNVDPLDGQPMQSFLIMGDQWQLDSRVIRWKLSLAQLGFNNLYRLDRLAGRYANIEHERNNPRTVYLIALSEPFDIWKWLQSNHFSKDWVEADYGNAVYAPMIDGAQYGVYLGHGGLFIRAENPIAIKALASWPA